MSVNPSSPAARFNTRAQRWQAILNRDPAADNQFVYAVKTTGIFCRPTCAARRPLQKNILDFDSPQAARHAGFRPCKRCRPELSDNGLASATIVTRLCRAIEQNPEASRIPSLVDQFGLTPARLQRLFKKQTGMTLKAYTLAQRAARLQLQLQTGNSISNAASRSGFNSPSRLYSESNQLLGMTPTRFRSGGPQTTIRFALGSSTLGAILVAATDLGICSILLGDDPEILLRDLQDRFPQAELVGSDVSFQKHVALVVGLVENPKLGLELPLDLRGTAFQLRVWNALRKIPPGKTLTYTELALRLDTPRSVRAVASACAANPLAVAVPCHRVVRLDGSLAGYRWGIDRKAELLSREQSPQAQSPSRSVKR